MVVDPVTSQRRPRVASTERGQRTRAAIIDAAATMMYESGVAATSVDDILAASNTGKSQLYHYFADKSELVAAVVDCQLERLLAAHSRREQKRCRHTPFDDDQAPRFDNLLNVLRSEAVLPIAFTATDVQPAPNDTAGATVETPPTWHMKPGSAPHRVGLAERALDDYPRERGRQGATLVRRRTASAQLGRHLET